MEKWEIFNGGVEFDPQVYKKSGGKYSVQMNTATPETKSTDDPYAEGTILTEVLGPHAKVKILVVLISDSHRDLNATEIARLAGIDRSTFYDHIDDLLAYDLVEVTRTVGNSKMYRINRENDAAEALAEFEWKLLDHVPEEG